MGQLIVILLGAIAVAGIVAVLFYPSFASDRAEQRLKSVSGSRGAMAAQVRSAGGRLMEGSRGSRRKQVQDTLKQIELKQAEQQKRMTLRTLIDQTGLSLDVRTFWMISAAIGLVLAAVPLIFGFPWYLCLTSGFVGLFGLPRWFLGYVRKRRLEKFLHDLPDSLDMMVRGLRAGLPLSDAMKIISSETPPPIGPEFWEVVEGQRVGITIEQGLERMAERVPLQEVNFLAIVLNVQAKTGGNLTETLGNLSKVLRDRRKMKGRIRAASQEAKSSAMIIGAMPILIMSAVAFLNPKYLEPLFTTYPGNMLLGFCVIWMLTGIFVMRRMINFDI